VEEIPGGATLRGEGGFGSTGITALHTLEDTQPLITSYFS
jgi:hypothetical protein